MRDLLVTMTTMRGDGLKPSDAELTFAEGAQATTSDVSPAGPHVRGDASPVSLTWRQHVAVMLWPLLCFIAILTIWGVTQSKISDEEQALTERVHAEAQARAKAYANHVSRSIEQADQVSRAIRYAWSFSGRDLQLAEQTQRGLVPNTDRLHAAVFDRKGDMVTSTVGKPMGINVSGQEWFQAQQRQADDRLTIGGPVLSPLVNKRVVVFSRRVEGPEHEFDGVVAVALDVSSFASLDDEGIVSGNAFVSVLRKDGTTLAINDGSNSQNMYSAFVVPPEFSSVDGVQRMPASDFIDQTERIVAWHRVADQSLISVAGLSVKSSLVSHEAIARDYFGFAVAGSLGCMLAAVCGTLYFYRATHRRRVEDEVTSAFRLATDNAHEGLYIVQALYNHEGTVIDFTYVDCNESGAALYGQTKDTFIGTRLSKLYGGDYFKTAMDLFQRTLEHGFHEDQVRVSPDSAVRATWINRRLVRYGEGLAITLRDISHAKQQEQDLSWLANSDALTTLPNRHWLMHYLPEALERARQSGRNLALLFVDLDDFKNINDTLGHAAGDKLLQASALRLKSIMRPHDNVVRLGGDEFTVILEDLDSERMVSRVADRLIQALMEPFDLSDGSTHSIRASVGISLFPQDGDSVETLLKHADVAMYAAKAAGKGRYEYYQPRLSANLMDRLSREQALRRAIDKDEFLLHYQPRVDTFSGEIRSMEALVRWMNPEKGMIPPNDFIPLAEETGLILKLGQLVIDKVCAQLAEWQAQGLPVVPVSINVSPRQFSESSVDRQLADAVNRHQLDHSLIEVELTESCMMGEEVSVNAQLAAIEALGIKLLVDDFGTGYSCLSQLQRLEVDALKVDRAFTARLCASREGEALFMAILSMAHVLGLSVVAEGVETVEELRVLQALSCNEVQGYFISRPVPAANVPALLEKRFLFPTL
ncbi:bifunctional diguanylate cyclase/phosphodiesterase [Noviherbaspirillum galbum]|uniref:EAL domain-containing protein n=1 Tax=Noviherbaspirillum galbum TaxID=2709383 RepID=A0A6B3SSZ1_9BURK|nr:EAL domain-containing protein [Noviherbaspirillum galbum]NEX64090.1 EAL domain-containing protein [Noviherbaspirillum galbum]